MFSERSIQILDLGALRLDRSIQRLRDLDRDGALDDLRAALLCMQEAKADAIQTQRLTAIIGAVERRG